MALLNLHQDEIHIIFSCILAKFMDVSLQNTSEEDHNSLF